MGHKRLIFVVDDEVVIAETLSLILRNAGFTAMAFHDAASAIAARTNHVPDLLISDVVMPSMTGVELAIYFPKASPSCGILLFSGQAATYDFLREAREQGHEFEILLKPLHPATLIEKLLAP